MVYDPNFTDPERFALTGFLAGYRGLTRDADNLDLRQFVAWCGERNLSLFEVPGRHRVLRPDTGGARRGPGHRGPATRDRDRVLPLRRRRGPSG
jgi:hypothetical protein